MASGRERSALRSASVAAALGDGQLGLQVLLAGPRRLRPVRAARRARAPARRARPRASAGSGRDCCSSSSSWRTCVALLAEALADLLLGRGRGRPARPGSARCSLQRACRARSSAASRSRCGLLAARLHLAPLLGGAEPAGRGVGQPLGGQGQVASSRPSSSRTSPSRRAISVRCASAGARVRAASSRTLFRARQRARAPPGSSWVSSAWRCFATSRSGRPARSSWRRASVSCTANFSSVSLAWRSALPFCRARLRIWVCTSAIRSSSRCRSLAGLLEPALGGLPAGRGRGRCPAASSNSERRSSARSESSRSIIFASITTPASLPRPVPRSRSWMSRSRTGAPLSR